MISVQINEGIILTQILNIYNILISPILEVDMIKIELYLQHKYFDQI